MRIFCYDIVLVASCLLISRTGTWSMFFTVRIFYDTAYVGTSHCFMSTNFMQCRLMSTFFIVRMFRSDTAYIGTSRCFVSTFFTHWYLYFFTVRIFCYDIAYVGTSHCFLSICFTHWCLVCLFHGENVSCRCSIRWYFSLLHVYFFHALVPGLPSSW